ncbi:hypothetical protein [Glycomyces sp. NRRL B-16210]|uniref:hypothetical protein n=1 Tax=Glycomyces sp. NRRL B-16210 TaxID=1463821 RepID=UPI00105F45BF|nr:hypothetical protein [Glycomyces sp. NRRL B-16210]
MTLLPDGMASASYDSSTDLYTVTDNSGQRFEMTEESFDEFITKMDSTISDLDNFRSRLLGGTVVTIREGWNQDYLSTAAIQDIDAVNPKFGGFDDAIELQEAYRTVFYPSRTEQLDRVYHGLSTGRDVSADIKVSYLETDDESEASLNDVQSGFDSRGGVTDHEVDEVRQDNERGGDGTGADPGAEGEAEDEPPTM